MSRRRRFTCDTCGKSVQARIGSPVIICWRCEAPGMPQDIIDEVVEEGRAEELEIRAREGRLRRDDT